MQIATNGPIDESISFQKSLTLRAADRFTPLFSGGQVVLAESPNSGTNLIDIEDLTFETAAIVVIQNSPDLLTATVAGNSFKATFNGPAIEMEAGLSGAGAVALDVSRNAMTVLPWDPVTVGIAVRLGEAANASGRIANNAIAVQGASGGIFAEATSMNLDVFGNQISGTNYNSGIEISP